MYIENLIYLLEENIRELTHKRYVSFVEINETPFDLIACYNHFDIPILCIPYNHDFTKENFLQIDKTLKKYFDVRDLIIAVEGMFGLYDVFSAFIQRNGFKHKIYKAINKTNIFILRKNRRGGMMYDSDLVEAIMSSLLKAGLRAGDLYQMFRRFINHAEKEEILSVSGNTFTETNKNRMKRIVSILIDKMFGGEQSA